MKEKNDSQISQIILTPRENGWSLGNERFVLNVINIYQLSVYASVSLL